MSQWVCEWNDEVSKENRVLKPEYERRLYSLNLLICADGLLLAFFCFSCATGLLLAFLCWGLGNV